MSPRLNGFCQLYSARARFREAPRVLRPVKGIALVDYLTGRLYGGHQEDYLLALEHALAPLAPIVVAPYRTAGGYLGRWRRLWHESTMLWRSLRDGRLLVFHTPEARELLLLAVLAPLASWRTRPAAVAVLRRDATVMTGRSVWRTRLVTAAAAWLIRRGWLMPVSDSRLAAQYWYGIGSRPVSLIPIPVRSGSTVSQRTGVFRIGLVGSFRLDKGADRYDAVIEAARRVAPEAEVICQVGAPVTSPEAELAAALLGRWLPSPGVKLLRNHLPAEEYDALLASCDLVVLPYDPDLFSSGTSGVMSDALTAGAVVVATPIMWAREEFASHSNIVWLAGRDGSDFERGIRLGLDRARALRATPPVDTADRAAFASAWRQVVEDALVSRGASPDWRPAR